MKDPIIDAQLPGGNILLWGREKSETLLRPDLRDTEGWWFYWRFRVLEAQGKARTFRFAEKNPIGVLGPAMSRDLGETWTWLGNEAVEEASFRYVFSENETEVWFSFNIPYQPSHLEAFLKRHASSECIEVSPLCTTRTGREVPSVRVGCLERPPKYRILLTARHHSCESMANYVLEGILEAALGHDETGEWFRDEVEILSVPFMDLDGVVDGDQGKNRRPHDHNRDYRQGAEGPLYPSVRALMDLVPSWSEGRLRVALDLHCPYLRGGGDKPGSNERIYFVGGPSQENWNRVGRLSEILEKERQGALPHWKRHNLPFGVSWNKGKDVCSCSRWTSSLEGVLVGATLEIPYAQVADVVVTPGACRDFGRDLARAIQGFLVSTEDPPALPPPS